MSTTQLNTQLFGTFQVKGSRDAKMKHVLELEIRCHSSPEPARRFFFCHFFGAFGLKFKKYPKVLGPMGHPKIFFLLKGCLKIFLANSRYRFCWFLGSPGRWVCFIVQGLLQILRGGPVLQTQTLD